MRRGSQTGEAVGTSGLRFRPGRCPHPSRAQSPRPIADNFFSMRIAIDSRALLAERTGIGTYTLAIAHGLAALPGLAVGLFAPRPIPPSSDDSGRFTLHADHHPFGIVWLQT